MYLSCFWFKNKGVEGRGSDQEQETKKWPLDGASACETTEDSQNRFASYHEFKEVREHSRLDCSELLARNRPG